MKIGFFGTPELAREILLDFLGDPTFEVVYIVSQPDRPVGREQIITPSPVSEVALEKDILLFRPEKVRGNTDFIDTLRNLSVDYIVVVAYGQILPQDILNLPKYLCINIHGSILPSYR